ncbi:SCN2A [Symbiodinium sp. KB8]|nr:SCN2A [Symbiodinium sp. KB8]
MPAPPRSREVKMPACSAEFSRLLRLLAVEHVKEVNAAQTIQEPPMATISAISGPSTQSEKQASVTLPPLPEASSPESPNTTGGTSVSRMMPEITIIRRDGSPSEEARGRDRIFSRQGSPCGDEARGRELRERETSKDRGDPSPSRERASSDFRKSPSSEMGGSAQHRGDVSVEGSWLNSMEHFDQFDLSFEQETNEGEDQSVNARLAAFLQGQAFESVLSVLLIANVAFMAFEMQYLGSLAGYRIGKYTDLFPSESARPTMNQVLLIGDLVFTLIFAIDVTVRIIVLRCRFWRTFMNWIDAFVVVTSSIQWFFPSLSINPIYLRLLRLGKLARALRMVTMSKSMDSLQLLLKCCASSVDMLFWSFCLLTFIQCIAGMIVGALVREFVTDDSKLMEDRQRVWDYYGTFSRTFLTMFEILFANWGPPCRALVDHVDEAFSIFFLVYRCMIGFAVLNVVNAVFVQQTMLLANNDEDLAFKQKQKDWAWYSKKVKRLFNAIDTSGDGSITLDEFSQLVQSPKLKFWMSQLELEYHDLLGLFEMLDDGDGEISIDEFLENARRLKGPAKAIDMFRMETKVELLLAQVLANTSPKAVRANTKNFESLFRAAGISRESPGFGKVFAVAEASSSEQNPSMFQEAPSHAYTVKVGPGETTARYRLPAPADVRHFLSLIADQSPAEESHEEGELESHKRGDQHRDSGKISRFYSFKDEARSQEKQRRLSAWNSIESVKDPDEENDPEDPLAALGETEDLAQEV